MCKVSEWFARLDETFNLVLYFRWQSTTSAAAAAAQYSNFSRAAAAGTALPPSRPYLNPATTSLEAAYTSPYHLGSPATMPQSFTSSVSEKESKMISDHGTSTYHASSATSTNFTPYHDLGNAQCLKITEKVSFNIASEASYVYKSSLKIPKMVHFDDFLKI